MRSLLAVARRMMIPVLLVTAALVAVAAVVALVTGDLATAAISAALAVALAWALGTERRGRTLEHLAVRGDRRVKALEKAVRQAADRHEAAVRQWAATRDETAEECRSTRLAVHEVAERQQQGTTAVLDRIGDADRTLATTARGNLIGTVVEQTALMNLFAVLQPRGMLPAPTDFSALPSTMLEIVTHLVAAHDDPVVVECGSGASTVWFALACQRRGGGRVVAIEHDPGYAEQTRAALERCGVGEYAQVRVAPIEAQEVRGETFRWYAPGAREEDLERIDVLFVDGPPGRTGPLARYPALPVFAEALADGALVVMDDATRDDEAEATERWLREDGRLRRLRTSSRAAFLRWSTDPSA